MKPAHMILVLLVELLARLGSYDISSCTLYVVALSSQTGIKLHHCLF